ncbi:GEgh 16 protein [Pleurotus pulmonarius]
MKGFYQLVLLAAAIQVNAHGVLTAVTGANGITAQGFGVVATTPRTGSRRNPFQQDSSIIRDREIQRGTTGACGRTLAGGNNNVQTMLATAVSAGLPMAAADGSVTMTLHQVNGDGAGPYTCQVSADASGQNFVAMTVTTQVPGTNSRSRTTATAFPLVAQMPAGMACTGGPNGDACLVRCRNAARAGPFGGCVAVTTANSGNAAAAAAAAAANATANAAAAANANANANAAAAANANAAAVATPAVAVDAAAAANAAANAAAGAATATPAVAANAGAAANGSAIGIAVNSPAVAANAGAAANAAAGAAVTTPAVTNTLAVPVAAAPVDNTAATTGTVAPAVVVRAIGEEAIPDISIEEAELALAEDLERREGEEVDDVSIEDAERALAEDLERRAERVSRSRIIGHRTI